MEELSHDNGVDATAIVEQLRTVAAERSRRYPRTWTPQATIEDVRPADREPIALFESLHYLHSHWDMSDALNFKGRGRGPKAILHRLLARVVTIALSDYLGYENAYRAATAQAIDAIAYRLDELTFDDERFMLEAVREDLLTLARHLEDRFEDPTAAS